MSFSYRYVKRTPGVVSYPTTFKRPLFLFQLTFMAAIIFIGTYSLKYFYKPSRAEMVTPIAQVNQVLGQTIENPMPTPTIAIEATPTLLIPTPTVNLFSPTPAVSLQKEVYKIAVFGDSMVDTMGEHMDYLQRSLKKKYSNNGFLLFNYGTGAQTVADGLNRFNKAFNYQTRNFPPINELKPDVLIIASFSYNPFLPHDKEKHRAILEQLITEAKKVTLKVYVLAEIAPLKRGFGKGINGVNWDENTSYEHATHIIEQLENTVNLSKSLKVPLIDAFTPSWVNSEKEGEKEYINPDDGIHPSTVGHQFIADLIASVIKLD